LHANPHDVPSQVAVAFAGALHAVHDVNPQLLTLLFSTHAEPHRCAPGLHVEPQLVPLHVAVALTGVGHGVQDVEPHDVTLLFNWQIPEQSCAPVEQTPMQDCVLGMHVPAHGLEPLGHAPPHEVPSHVAVPPAGTAHAVHDAPQLDTLVFDRHAPLQA
jgi:hypothetical protein